MKRDFDHPTPKKKKTPSTADEIENAIRRRAYELYEERGYVDGFELEDWAQAEAELLNSKPTAKAA